MVKQFFRLFILMMMVFLCQIPASASNIKKVCVKTYCYVSPVMATQGELQRGLQGKKLLEKNEGMLFSFKHDDYHGFWMRNMQFPIDMIWINGDKRIIHIEHYVPPCHEDICPIYKPSRKARYVLEVRAGESVRNGFRLLDKVDLFDLAPSSLMGSF